MEKNKSFEEKNQIDLTALANELEKLNRAIKSCPHGYFCPIIAEDYPEETIRNIGLDPNKIGCPGCNVFQSNY